MFRLGLVASPWLSRLLSFFLWLGCCLAVAKKRHALVKETHKDASQWLVANTVYVRLAAGCPKHMVKMVRNAIVTL